MNAVVSKACSRCSGQFPLEQFTVNKRYADGYVSWCKGCVREYSREHYRANREKAAKQTAEWYQANRAAVRAKGAAYYAANKSRVDARVRANKAARPDQYREIAKLCARKRRASRVDVRLRSRISSQFRYCLATGKGGRTTESLLGYTIAELRTHLERQFLRGMTWDNMGEWHVDHIVPLASFTITGADCPELKRAWALPNLRPLWARDNLSKSAKRVSLL